MFGSHGPPVLEELFQITLLNLMSAAIVIAISIFALTVSQYLSIGPVLQPAEAVELDVHNERIRDQAKSL